MISARFFVSAIAAVFLAVSVAKADDAKPIRHLVYQFSITIDGTNMQEGYAGSTTSSSSTGDRGTITADVVAVQPDSGLVVRISEQARNTRSADAAMCVAYGNGQIICDNSKKINEEEYALLRVIGKDFVNPAVIDANKSWTYSTTSSDTDETNKYHIDSDANGVMSISLQRVLRVKGPQSYTASTDGHVTYDPKMEIPRSLSEDTITRVDGAQATMRNEQQISLTLTDDSMAKTP